MKICAINGSPRTCDDLYPVLEKLREAYAVVLVREFISDLVERKIPTACVCTINVMEEEMLRDGYRQNLELWEMFLANYFGQPQILYVFNTYQFEHFPQNCQKAFELGKNLVTLTGGRGADDGTV